MSRPRVLALAGVLLLLVGALVLRGQRSGGTAAAASPDLAPLRARAALLACPPGVGATLPDLELPCLGGGPGVRLRATPPGTPTLVTVYGSWCGPCQEETPLLVTLAARAGRRIALLGVDTEDDPAEALHFAIDFRVHWPSLVDDDGAVLRHFGSGPPVTLFVDAGGRVRSVQRGQFHSLAALEAAVLQHLGVRV